MIIFKDLRPVLMIGIDFGIATRHYFERTYPICKYCFRHDNEVTRIDSDGLSGYYHPHCASKIINEFIMALAERMK